MSQIVDFTPSERPPHRRSAYHKLDRIVADRADELIEQRRKIRALPQQAHDMLKTWYMMKARELGLGVTEGLEMEGLLAELASGMTDTLAHGKRAEAITEEIYELGYQRDALS